jgi:hypothetical protein
VTAAGRPVAVLHVWGTRSVPSALWRMARGRLGLSSTPHLRFAKLLGTGSGETFTPRDADPGHWAALTVWDDADAARSFETSRLVRSWDDAAHERLRVAMTPLSSRGRWAGGDPFAGGGTPRRPDGPVVAITRARIRTARALQFWRAVPAVSTDLRGSAGLRMSMGIGEAPVGLQGTVSLWDSTEPLLDFAYRRPAHLDVVRRTAEVGWYAEELFARLAVDELEGTYRGRTP